MIDIRPLPTLTRCYHGEDVATYSTRHAARNSLTVVEVEKWLREQGHLRTANPRDPARLAAWRALGALHKSAFTTASLVSGNRVTDRLLCRGCTSGYTARGRLPGIGLVCLKHRRWLGSRDQPQVNDRDILAAEVGFRTILARAGELFDSPVLDLAGDISALGDSIADQPSPQPWLPPDAQRYPTQIRLARVLTTTFVDSVIASRHDSAARTAACRAALDAAFPVGGRSTRWRAEYRLNQVAAQLNRDTVAARLSGDPPTDEWNILRHATQRPISQQPAGSRDRGGAA